MPLIAQTNVSTGPVNDLDANLNITVHRNWTSGQVAPEGVGFEINPTGPDIPASPDYSDGGVYNNIANEWPALWNFDDVDERFTFLKNVVNLRNNRNIAPGFRALHTFRTFGTRVVSCTLTDPNSGKSKTEYATVTSGATTDLFPAANTFFVDPNGVFANMPIGATPYTDGRQALLDAYGDSTPHRIMFEWGSVSTIAAFTINAMQGTGHIMISPPDTGSGEMPRVNVTGSGFLYPIRGMGNSFRTVGIYYQGPWNPVTETGTPDCDLVNVGSSAKLVHLHGNKVRGFQDALTATSFTHTNNHNVFADDNDFGDWRNFGVSEFSIPNPAYKTFKAYVGNVIAQNPMARAGADLPDRNIHGPMRIRSTDDMVLAQNDMFSCNGWSGLGNGFNAHQPCFRGNSTPRPDQFGILVAMWNTMEGGNIIMELGPRNGGAGGNITYPHNFVTKQNLLIASHQTAFFVTYGAGGGSLENNLGIRGPEPTLQGTSGGDPEAFYRWFKSEQATAEAEASPLFIGFNSFINRLADASTWTGAADSARYDGTANGGSPGILNFITGENVFLQEDVATAVDSDVPFTLVEIIGSDGVTPIRPRSLGYVDRDGVLDTSVAPDPDMVRLYVPTGANPAIDSADPAYVLRPLEDFLGNTRPVPRNRGAIEAA